MPDAQGWDAAAAGTDGRAAARDRPGAASGAARADGSVTPGHPAAAGRIAALDMLRGYALVCIMLNHLPNGVLRALTVSNFFLFDAAEMFVLLSGFLVGLVWLRLSQRAGVGAAQRRFAVRAFQVWRAMMIAAVCMALLSALLQQMGLHHTAIWRGYAELLLHRPLHYLVAVGSLWMQPNLLDVLALYAILLAVTPLVMPALARWPLQTAAMLVVVWWFAVPLNLLLPNERPNETGLLFNPFGWQALFFTGAGLGLYRAPIMTRLRRHGRLVTVLALGVLGFGALVLIGWKVGEPLALLRNGLFRIHGVIEKWPLDGARYLSILAAAWMVAGPMAPLFARLAATAPGRALANIGRGGLVSFVACVLLSVIADAVQTEMQASRAARLAADLWAIPALWLVAEALSRREAALAAAAAGRVTRPGPSGQPAGPDRT